MKIHILGAAGWIPGKNQTSCVMIETEDALLFLDAGTGMANVGEYKDILSQYDTFFLILSHYHLDHLIGLIYLEPYVRDKKLRIIGPGKTSYPETTDYYIHSLLRKEFFSRSIDDFSSDVKIYDFPSPEFNVGRTKISTSVQKHTAPSFRIIIDDKLIYATDTIFDSKEWVGVTGEVLLHECWGYKKDSCNTHTSLWQLTEELPVGNFKKIILIHQNPMWNTDDYEEIKRIIEGTNICLAQDGMQLGV